MPSSTTSIAKITLTTTPQICKVLSRFLDELRQITSRAKAKALIEVMAFESNEAENRSRFRVRFFAAEGGGRVRWGSLFVSVAGVFACVCLCVCMGV